MSDIFQWLYSTIPFIQLFNNRFNILGFIWFISLTVLTLKCLKDSGYSFGAKSKRSHYLGITVISIFSVWVFYRLLDELLTISTVLSWDPSLLNLNPESLVFWMGKGLSISILVIGFNYLYNYLKLKIFKFKWLFPLVFLSVLIIQSWSVGIFKTDYAVLSGIERITVFWTFYPLLYISYTILYLTVIKWRKL